MKKYTLSAAAAIGFKHLHPERTASKSHRGLLDFDLTFQVWPSRESMARSIRMQQRREPRNGDWRPVVPLSDGEGY